MELTKESATDLARRDLASRLGISVEDISVLSVADREFPNSALGATIDGEMAAMMMSSGWRIELEADDAVYEYRADKNQLRLHNFQAKNYVIKS